MTTTTGPTIVDRATPPQRAAALAAADRFLELRATEFAQVAEAAKAQQQAILMQGGDGTCEGKLVVEWTVSLIAWEELQRLAATDLRAAARARLGTAVFLVYEAGGVGFSDLLFVLTEEEEALAKQVRGSIALVLRGVQGLRAEPIREAEKEAFLAVVKDDVETALRSLGLLEGLPAAQEHLAACGGWPEDFGPAPDWLDPPPPPEPTVH